MAVTTTTQQQQPQPQQKQYSSSHNQAQHRMHKHHYNSNSNSNSYNNRQHGWSWAHVQQRLRRNRLVGPVAFCLVVLLVMPACIWNTEHSPHNNNRVGIILQHLPLVEAVPFFRRSINNSKPKPASASSSSTSVTSDGSSTGSSSALGSVATAVAAAEETVAATSSSSSSSSSKQHQSNTKKRKISSRDYTQYNFPLIQYTSRRDFEKDQDAPIPLRYLQAHQDNQDNARKATLATLQWRANGDIDTILSRPHVNYDVAKRILPHYFIGHSPVTGHVVFIQRPGLSDLALAKHNDISLPDMLYQYAYVFEYCWNVIYKADPSATQLNDEALMISIIDLQGLNLSIIRKPELIHFVKEFVGMIDAHYPTRAYKTYMINAPQWFSTLYRIISPIMRETTKEKIVLYSAGNDQDKAIIEALGKDMGTQVNTALSANKTPKKAPGDLSLSSDILLQTEMEQDIRNFVVERLEQDGLEMKPIAPLTS